MKYINHMCKQSGAASVGASPDLHFKDHSDAHRKPARMLWSSMVPGLDFGCLGKIHRYVGNLGSAITYLEKEATEVHAPHT